MQPQSQARVCRSFDLFGQNILLNLNGEDNYRTGGGGFLSLTIIGIVAIFFQSNIIQFLSKSQVTSDTQLEFNTDPDRLYLTDDNFMLALSIDQPTKYNTNPFFNISIKRTSQVTYPNGTVVKYANYTPMVPCTVDRFQKVFDKYNYNFTSQFTTVGLGNWICPEPGYNYTIGGRFSSVNYDYFKIEVSACKNNTNNPYWNPVCASNASVQSYLATESSFRIRFYITNLIANPQLPSDFLQPFLDDSLFYSFNPNKLVRKVNVYMKKLHVETDDSLFPVFTDVQEQNLLQFESQDAQDDLYLGLSTDTVFCSMFIQRSPYTKAITRAFTKLDALLSYLGGFANIIVVVLGFFVALYNKQQCKYVINKDMIELANSIYTFNLNDKDEETILRQKTQGQSNFERRVREQTINLKKQTLVTPNFRFSDKLPDDHDHISEANAKNQSPKSVKIKKCVSEHGYSPKNQSLKKVENSTSIPRSPKEGQLQKQELLIKTVGFKSRKDYLTSQIKNLLSNTKQIYFKFDFLLNQMTCGYCFRAKETKLLNKAVNQIQHDLDIFIILEKIREITSLKELFLTKEQQILFNFSPKPIIELKEQKRLPSRTQLEKSSQFVSDKTMLEASSQFGIADVAGMAILKHSTHSHGINKELKVYNKVFKAYDKILQSRHFDNPINLQLVDKLGQEIRDIFEVTQYIDFDDHKSKISKRIQGILKRKLQQIRNQSSHNLSQRSSGDEEINIFSVERARFTDQDAINRQIVRSKN